MFSNQIRLGVTNSDNLLAIGIERSAYITALGRRNDDTLLKTTTSDNSEVLQCIVSFLILLKGFIISP